MADALKCSNRWTRDSWVKLRKWVQVLVFGLFLVSFLSARGPAASPGFRGQFNRFFLRLDPLTALAGSISNRGILAGSTLAILTVLLTLLLGRAWCGWLCPLGTILDWIPLRDWNRSSPPTFHVWRRVKYVLLITILLSAIFANVTLLVFDPLTILYRTLSTSIWPVLDRLVTAGERWLYQVPLLQRVVGRVDALLRPRIFPVSPLHFRYPFLYGGIFLSIIGLNLAAPRFWCRNLCPLGALLGFLGKFSLLKVKIEEGCSGCSHCLTVCPTGAIHEKEGDIVADASECTLCMSCLPGCPTDKIAFPTQLSPAGWQPYDPGRRQVLIGLGASIVGVGLLSSGARSKHSHPRLIRPPGVDEEELLSLCIRCGECVSACPTGGIQPAVHEAGVEGLWTPILVPRLGYCDFSCHACGQVCPVQAIPALSLEEKREQILGRAYIDRDRCIAWADNMDCIVCEEMCPIAEKAIVLETVEADDPTMGRITVNRPHVRAELCIGCGICEYKCPVAGSAAIRVSLPSGRGGFALPG